MIVNMNKWVIAATAILVLTASQSAAFAATDHSGFGQDLFTNQSPGALQDPAYTSASADPSAAAVAAIEPAAGNVSEAPPSSAKQTAKDTDTSPKTNQ